MPKPKPALERIARKLCQRAGVLENITYEGRPMWEQFLPDAEAILAALMDGASDEERRVILGWME